MTYCLPLRRFSNLSTRRFSLRKSDLEGANFLTAFLTFEYFIPEGFFMAACYHAKISFTFSRICSLRDGFRYRIVLSMSE